MIRNKKLISIIPVRKNSTGIKNKIFLKFMENQYWKEQ